MLVTATFAQIALMVAGPVVLGAFLVRRLGTRPRLLAWGAATFIAAQALRFPLLWALTHATQAGILPAPPAAMAFGFNILVLSLTASLFEETARYVGYRFVLPDARDWSDAVTYGAGHGGIESIILGALVALTLANMTALAGADPDTLTHLDAGQRAVLTAQVSQYWASPWYMPLLGGIERAFAICLHMALAVIVLKAVVTRRLLWLVAAIAAHATANASAAVALQRSGPVAAELLLMVFAVLSLWLLYRLRPDREAQPAADRPGP